MDCHSSPHHPGSIPGDALRRMGPGGQSGARPGYWATTPEPVVIRTILPTEGTPASFTRKSW